MVSEAVVLGEAEVRGSMPPCGRRLVPAWRFLSHRKMRVIEEDGGIGPSFLVKVSRLGLVVTHVVRGVHALVLTQSFLARHANKFMSQFYYEFKYSLERQ